MGSKPGSSQPGPTSVRYLPVPHVFGLQSGLNGGGYQDGLPYAEGMGIAAKVFAFHGSSGPSGCYEFPIEGTQQGAFTWCLVSFV